MMYKIFRISFVAMLIACAMAANAQSTKLQKKVNLPAVKGVMTPALQPQALTGLEEANPQAVSVPSQKPVLPRSLTAETAGLTHYDLQSNGTEQSRLHIWPDGNVSAAWTQALVNEAGGWSDRGSSVNTRDKWLAGNTPAGRIETVRTGFTNYVVAEDGTEMTFAHRTAGGIYYIHMSRRVPGGNWVESDVPSPAPKGQLWCKAASDGNNIYLLGLTTPVGSGGVEYAGMDGAVLFWRSQDGGVSWDIQGATIPGLDSSAYYSIGPDSYAITAHDGVVAVGIFDSWNDLKVTKSYDGGSNWEEASTVLDFPLDSYQVDAGYTFDDLFGFDEDAPDSLAIFTNDGAGSLLLDNAGFLHVFVGRMYVIDADLTDGNTSYYPGMNGLMYWNEYTPETLSLIAGSPDLDGNDTLDISGTINNVAYGCNISSMASPAVSTLDTIYVAFSAMIERLNDDATNPLRHVLLIKSGDLGASWEWVYDVHYEAEEDPLLADLQEGVYPYMNHYVGTDGLLHMIYQRDYAAGANVLVTGTQTDPAEIVYLAPNTSGTKAPVNNLELSISPNPASDRTILNYSLDNGTDAQVNVYNAVGTLVYSQNMSAQSGSNLLAINTAAFANGVYTVRVNAGKFQGTTKLSVVK